MHMVSTRFILIGTQHAENVGAAARAMWDIHRFSLQYLGKLDSKSPFPIVLFLPYLFCSKTMGFNELSLVSPQDAKVLRRHKVIQRASGAKDVLSHAKIFSNLEEAVHDRDVVCGTGMPFDMHAKRLERRYVEPRLFFDKLANDKRDDDHIRLALVFGSEQTGKAVRVSMI